jgi:hypothetical protein
VRVARGGKGGVRVAWCWVSGQWLSGRKVI